MTPHADPPDPLDGVAPADGDANANAQDDAAPSTTASQPGINPETEDEADRAERFS